MSAKAVAQNAAEARGLLREVSRQLQEAATASEGTEKQPRFFQIVETVAEVSVALFALEKGGLSDQAVVNGAMLKLREAMLSVQHPSLGEALVVQCGEPIARALAILYAAGRRHQRESGASPELMAQLSSSIPPRSSSPRKRAHAMMPMQGEHEAETATLQALGARLPALSSPPSRTKPVLRIVDEPKSVPPSTGSEGQSSSEELSLSTRSRRASQRATVEVDVGFVSESNFYAGLAMDVSTGGLFVATYMLRPVGTPVTLSFVLPDGHAVTTSGVVRWVRESGHGEGTPGLGIAFQDLSKESLWRVEQFCKTRPPLYFDVDDE